MLGIEHITQRRVEGAFHVAAKAQNLAGVQEHRVEDEEAAGVARRRNAVAYTVTERSIADRKGMDTRPLPCRAGRHGATRLIALL